MKIPDYPSQPMLTRDFLERAPLYKIVPLQNITRLDALDKSESITQNCPKCGEATFNFKNFDYNSHWMAAPDRGVKFDVYKNKSIKINYECKGCSSFEMVFTVRFSEDGKAIQKVGQFPSINVDIDNETAQMLGEHVALYRKGLICESHSYGIAAFAYYRRIVENIIGKLLEEATSLVSEENRDQFQLAIASISSDKIAEDKIKIATDLLPASLRPNDNNPLRLMYEICSVGIHGLSDEDCLNISLDIRENLESFIHLLNSNKRASSSLSASTKRLLAKRADLLAKSKKPAAD